MVCANNHLEAVNSLNLVRNVVTTDYGTIEEIATRTDKKTRQSPRSREVSEFSECLVPRQRMMYKSTVFCCLTLLLGYLACACSCGSTAFLFRPQISPQLR